MKHEASRKKHKEERISRMNRMNLIIIINNPDGQTDKTKTIVISISSCPHGPIISWQQVRPQHHTLANSHHTSHLYLHARQLSQRYCDNASRTTRGQTVPRPVGRNPPPRRVVDRHRPRHLVRGPARPAIHHRCVRHILLHSSRWSDVGGDWGFSGSGGAACDAGFDPTYT